VLPARALARLAERGGERARAGRAAPDQAGHRAPPPLGGAVSRLRGAGRGGPAARRDGHPVRAAPARAGDLPQDLPEPVLRAAAGDTGRPVRLAREPGRADEHAAPRPGLLPGRARAGPRGVAPCRPGRPRWCTR
jgi:hypothetical protein